MSQNVRRIAVLAGPRRWVAFAAVALVVAVIIGLPPLLDHQAGRRVVVRSVTEMPKLDTGVRQAVHVTFAGDRQPTLGQPASLRFVVTSGAPDAEIEARITPPAGATVTAGRASWEGRLAYQQAAEIPVSVVFPGDRGGFVRGEVITRLPDGQLFRNATAVYVDPGASDTQVPEARTLIEPDGSRLDVVVYKNQ